MIFKYILLSIISVILVTASDSHFGTDLTWQKIPKQEKDDVREMPWMSSDSFRSYLEDYDDRVADEFIVSDYFYPTVNFWFMIYTQFDSGHVVIHDKTDLSIIYKVLDFSPLQQKNLSKNIIYVLQGKITEERVKNLKEQLKELVHNPSVLNQNTRVFIGLYKTQVLKFLLINLRGRHFLTGSEIISAPKQAKVILSALEL